MSEALSRRISDNTTMINEGKSIVLSTQAQVTSITKALDALEAKCASIPVLSTKLDRLLEDVAAETARTKKLETAVMELEHAIKGATGTFNDLRDEMREERAMREADKAAKLKAKEDEEEAAKQWAANWRDVFKAQNATALIVIASMLGMLYNSIQTGEPIDHQAVGEAIKASQTLEPSALPAESLPEVTP